jgi:hypothetical protein
VEELEKAATVAEKSGELFFFDLGSAFLGALCG